LITGCVWHTPPGGFSAWDEADHRTAYDGLLVRDLMPYQRRSKRLAEITMAMTFMMGEEDDQQHDDGSGRPLD